MKRLKKIPQKVEISFTNSHLTGSGGHIFLSHAAKRFGLPSLLDKIKLKQRKRGSSDKEQLLSLIYSLASGNGHLADLDVLRKEQTSLRLLGLPESPSSRRLGEYLRRFTSSDIDTLHSICRCLTRKVAPKIIEHSSKKRGYVPVFIDGTAIEVGGQYFENAKKGYNGEDQYWLHGIFVDGLWVSQRLHPGGTGVNFGWREQLKNDVVPLLSDCETPIWIRGDNAYYCGKFVSYCYEQGYDYSVSVTNPNNKQPIIDTVKDQPDMCWTAIGMGEEAILTSYRPGSWEDEQHYVVVKSMYEGKQGLLFPAYTVILVSRNDLPLKELVLRHRGKQGQENAFKGPLIELDLHHPPCQSFIANQAIYACGLIAQVLLKAIQFNYLPDQARTYGIRTIIRYCIRTVAKLVHTARKWKLLFSRDNFYADWIKYAAVQLE